MTQDVWALGDAYEAYVGRWSRRVAVAFLAWLDVPDDRHWLDVGCGTGALTSTILTRANPAGVVGIDPADGFLETARSQVTDPRAGFQWGDAQGLPMPDHLFDAVVSGLAINFVPEPALAAAEMARVTAPGGVAAAYVWDYADGMLMMRHFWDAAVELDPAAAALVESSRFPLCRPDPLRELWLDAGLTEVTVEPIVVETRFADFDDYWGPFLGGQGPAPAYAMSLPEERRAALRELIRAGLPIDADGAVPLTARAWAVRGTAPE